MGSIKKISNDDIQASLKHSTRQYLVGDLQRPQDLTHIHSDDIEVGVSRYPDMDEEDAHYHTQAYEFQYMLSGHTVYIDIETRQEFEFKKGDFFLIEPYTVYAQKIKKGTEILFFKTPPGNDKVVVESEEFINAWFKNKIKTIRTDYYRDPKAPAANSIKPATSAVILNQNNQILFLKRKDNDLWTLPGGTLKYNESLEDCIKREVLEETGLHVSIDQIIGTYTNPDIKIAYNDGEVRREFTIVYYAIAESYSVQIDDESCEYKWVSPQDALNVELAESQSVRIKDALKFLQNKVSTE